MSSYLRYHLGMRPWLPVLLIMAGMAAVPSVAQINGTRASVTSVGGSLIFPPGPRASVTSLGPLGYTPNFGFPGCCSFHLKNPHHSGFGNGRFGYGNYGYGYGVLPLYSMPYSYGGYGDIINPVDDSMEQAYGPASGPQQIQSPSAAQQQSDDRLSRLEQQMDELESANVKSSQAPASVPQTPVADQPETVLVFRDGHSIDVKNYAIVGDTLYDFSSGSRRKIAIADLDLGATQKENDERGLDFRLPTRPLGN